jgi:hypothetical protein
MAVAIARYITADTGPLHFELAAQWLAEQVRALLPDPVRGEETGVYLSTPDTGAAASVEFWHAALNDGLGFANPRDFPWTLANSAAAYVSMRNDLRGPNYTLVGDGEASCGAFNDAIDDLEAGIVRCALVLRFVVGGGEIPTSIQGLALWGNGSIDHPLCLATSIDEQAWLEGAVPSDPIVAMCAHLANDRDVVLSTP